ncbi:MAG: hypothetical protein ACXVGE_14275 [Blastococcus sp.]
MTDEQLAAIRRYTSAEVVQMLNIPAKWLKELVRDDRVPHRRTGATRGVWFTAEDVLKIGEMLPDLMSRRRTIGEARPADGQPDDVGVPGTPAPAEPSAQMLAEWAQLRGHQRTPRRKRA